MKLRSTLALLTGAALLTAGAARPAAAQTTETIDFDTLLHPVTGVGPATNAYQEHGLGANNTNAAAKGSGTFSLVRIADTSNPSSFGDHFHEVAGNSDPSNPAAANQTAADFFSDDGAPFMFFEGDYSGTNSNTYAPIVSTEKVFSLVSFNVLSLNNDAGTSDPVSYTLTSSNGSTLLINHPGVYNLANTPALANFRNILSYRQDYTGVVDADMVVDDITIAAAPEPGALTAFLCGGAVFVAAAWRARRNGRPA